MDAGFRQTFSNAYFIIIIKSQAGLLFAIAECDIVGQYFFGEVPISSYFGGKIPGAGMPDFGFSWSVRHEKVLLVYRPNYLGERLAENVTE